MTRTTRRDLDALLDDVNYYLSPEISLVIHHDATGYTVYRTLDHGVSQIYGINHGMTAGELYHVLTGMLAALYLHYDSRA